jgi:RNA polymerase sigma factor (TIGR02999 family)
MTDGTNDKSRERAPGPPRTEGQSSGTDTLFAVVYENLRGLARARMTHEHQEQTLQTTALVHEVYLRLQRDAEVTWDSAAHFFGAAAEAMRRILIERARRRLTRKRGGDRKRLTLEDFDLPAGVNIDAAAEGMVELDEALRALEKLDPRMCDVVKLRYFVGMSVDETAAALERSTRTVKRDWAFARAWLARRIQGAE